VILPGIWDTRSAAAYLPDPHEEYTGDALASFFTPSVRYWGVQIEAWSAAYGIDPNLAATVMQIESCGDPLAKSRAGAAGLFQVMPLHFDPGDDYYEPATNASRGLAYLQITLAGASGDVSQALAAYNGGITQIGLTPAEWPAESRRYAEWGAGIYTDAAAGAASSRSLEDWLNHGGVRLCWQAERRLGIP
jgi:soluble lytic murein transglycosylase-like protein